MEHLDLWRKRLSDVSSRLAMLNGSTEDEFLSIGARLQDFHGRAAEIEGMTRDVADLVLGEGMGRDMALLQGIVERISQYLSHAEAEMGESTTTLRTIHTFIGHVEDPLEGFRKIIKNLHMLSIAVKIESARLGEEGAGFTTLADDVERLSVSIRDKSVAILSEKQRLQEMIRETLARLASIEAQRQRDVRRSLEGIKESLATLSEIHGRCSGAVSTVTASSAETAASIAEVVTALQFHDITRQQIDHVKDALDELCVRLDGSDSDLRKMAGEVADICEIQMAQLRHARQELHSAVSRIVESLRTIAGRQSLMSEETRVMAGTADRAGNSFFSDLEREMGMVTELLSENAVANRNLTSAMEAVVTSVQDIAGFVTDIEEIGCEIELIALNSQVKAANTGEGGAALGVLAEAIQHLSLDARGRTGAVSDTLRKVTEVTESLSREIDTDAKAVACEVDALLTESQGLLGAVRDVNERLMELLGRIDAAVQSLSGDIESTTGMITVHETSAEVIDGAVSEIDDLLAEVRRLVPVSPSQNRELRLQGLAERYTMHSERHVHHAIVKGKGSPAVAVPHNLGGPAIGADGDGLGDNVELF